MHLMLRMFGNHDKTDLRLPETGLVVVTGKNGAGKSMLGEAITWCLWGDVIRSPQRGWSPIVDGTVVRLSLGGSVYTRSCQGERTKFIIDSCTSKTENALTVKQRFGDSKLFFATRIFHRSLLVKFSNATDGERKALIEYLLGATRFDICLAETKKEYSFVLEERFSLDRECLAIKEKLALAKGVQQGLTAPGRPKATAEVVEAKLWLSKSMRNDKRHQVVSKPNEQAFRVARENVERAQAELMAISRDIARIQRVLDLGKCPMCGASAETSATKAFRHAEAMRSALVTNIKMDYEPKLVRERADYEAACELYDDYRLGAADRERMRQMSKSIVRGYEQRKADFFIAMRLFSERKQQIKHVIEERQAQVNELVQRIARYDVHLKRLEDLMLIFGGKGARLTMLHNAFIVISRVSTAIVRHIYRKDAKVIVSVSPDKDTVTLTVRFADKENISYRGLSEGERSIIDFSLLKALSMLRATNPHVGPRALPIIYDDILDAVDASNAEKISRFLLREAEKDLVFVFSHNEDISILAEHAECYRVHDGQVERVT